MRSILLLFFAFTAGKAVAQQVDLGFIQPFIKCEDNTDGFATFILSEHGDAILNGLAAQDYTIAFYYDQESLDGGIALPNAYNNATQFTQSILVKVWETANPANSDTGVFDLIVDEQPEAYPTAISVCDSDGVPDGYYTIDLTSTIPEVLAGQTTMTVSFHLNETDAANGTNPIAGVQNFGTVTQTIYARVTTPLGACYSTSEIEISVNTPVALQPGDVS